MAMDIQFDFEAELKKIEDRIKDAEENLGDIEVRDGILAKAELYEKHGYKDKAIEAFNLALAKTLGVSKKLEITFQVLLIHMKDQNLKEIKEKIDQCKIMLEEGGDWEKRNRLKVILN
jgi:26S proteasome regulatory subunit N7